MPSSSSLRTRGIVSDGNRLADVNISVPVAPSWPSSVSLIRESPYWNAALSGDGFKAPDPFSALPFPEFPMFSGTVTNTLSESPPVLYLLQSTPDDSRISKPEPPGWLDNRSAVAGAASLWAGACDADHSSEPDSEASVASMRGLSWCASTR